MLKHNAPFNVCAICPKTASRVKGGSICSRLCGGCGRKLGMVCVKQLELITSVNHPGIPIRNAIDSICKSDFVAALKDAVNMNSSVFQSRLLAALSGHPELFLCTATKSVYVLKFKMAHRVMHMFNPIKVSVLCASEARRCGKDELATKKLFASFLKTYTNKSNQPLIVKNGNVKRKTRYQVVCIESLLHTIQKHPGIEVKDVLAEYDGALEDIHRLISQKTVCTSTCETRLYAVSTKGY